MTRTLPLQPQEEASLIAAALRQALEKIVADVPDVKGPTRSLRGLLSKYGPAPSAEDIDENRAEMLANFPRSDF